MKWSDSPECVQTGRNRGADAERINEILEP